MSRTPAAARRTIIKVTLLAGACWDEQRSLWASGAENASNPRGMMHVRAPVAQLDRAPDFESVGRRFESCRARQASAPLAQLDRASASGAEGHRFESCRARHFPISRHAICE